MKGGVATSALLVYGADIREAPVQLSTVETGSRSLLGWCYKFRLHKEILGMERQVQGGYPVTDHTYVVVGCCFFFFCTSRCASNLVCYPIDLYWPPGSGKGVWQFVHTAPFQDRPDAVNT